MEHIWSLEGKLTHSIFSPKGEIEGLLLSVADIPVQFVVPPEMRIDAAALKPGQALVLEGTVRPPSHKGETAHELYDLCAIGKVDGKKTAADAPTTFDGTVARFNYAKHGEPNGFVLDNGDFVHTKPGGFKQLGVDVGARLKGRGEASRMASGAGWVYQAESVNGMALQPH